MRYVWAPMARALGAKDERSVERFAEQGWLVAYYACSWAAGLVRLPSLSLKIKILTRSSTSSTILLIGTSHRKAFTKATLTSPSLLSPSSTTSYRSPSGYSSSSV